MLSRSIVVQSLRSIRDRFFDTRRQKLEQSDVKGTSDDVTGPSLDNLSVRHDSLNFLSIYLPDALLQVHTAIYVRNVILAYYVLITDSILYACQYTLPHHLITLLI